jgi:23S rRNA (adenine2503-C2)-methyltransferase
MILILRHTQESYSEAIQNKLGKGRIQAAAIYAHWIRFGKFPEAEGWNEKQSWPLAQEIIALTDVALPEFILKKEEGAAAKFLLKFGDRLESETVVIPMEAGITLCVSSQVGCRMGCTFCETGRMGLLRHLTAQEIVSQVFYARHELKAAVRNIVFMGMGEPFDNYDEVMQAVKVLCDPAGFGFGPSRITISTSGKVDAIDRMTQEADPALNLAVSVNGPNDLIRQKIMPVNRQWNMAQLKEAMLRYCEHPRRQILAEYVLLQGVNDSLESADELADYLSGVRVKINVIPYNPQSKDRFAPPSLEGMEAFVARLRSRGYQVLLRHSKGQKIMAACGQLGNLQLRKQLTLVK